MDSGIAGARVSGSAGDQNVATRTVCADPGGRGRRFSVRFAGLGRGPADRPIGSSTILGTVRGRENLSHLGRLGCPVAYAECKLGPPAQFHASLLGRGRVRGSERAVGRFYRFEVAERGGFIHASRRSIVGAAAPTSLWQRVGPLRLDSRRSMPENVLRDEDRLTVIDFDDAGFGWYLWEFVTAVFFLQETPAYEPALRSMILGYRESRALNDADLAVIPDLLVIRGLVYLGWFHTRRETDTAKEMALPITRLTVDLAKQLLAGKGVSNNLIGTG